MHPRKYLYSFACWISRLVGFTLTVKLTQELFTSEYTYGSESSWSVHEPVSSNQVGGQITTESDGEGMVKLIYLCEYAPKVLATFR